MQSCGVKTAKSASLICSVDKEVNSWEPYSFCTSHRLQGFGQAKCDFSDLQLLHFSLFHQIFVLEIAMLTEGIWLRHKIY